MEFFTDVFEKGRKNLLLVESLGKEFTEGNCTDALEAYGQYWRMKEWFKANPSPIFYEDELPGIVAMLEACIAFLDVRDAIAAKHFPWGTRDRKRALEDRNLVTLYLEKCRNPRFEDS